MRKIDILLLFEVLALISTTTYLIYNWNSLVTVGLNVISLLWVEIVYLIYINLKER